jgi:hypothetical protein
VAGLLRQGGQDSRLAHGIVVKALGESNDKYTQALARTGNMTDALMQIIGASSPGSASRSSGSPGRR